MDVNNYLNQCWNIVDWTLVNKLRWKINRNLYIFITKCILKRRKEIGVHIVSASAIIWTNDGFVYWCKYTLLGFDGLII